MRDPKTEQFLEGGKYAWEYREKVTFLEIDFKASADNPARAHRKIDEDRVIQYGMAMEAGADFPAPVFIVQDNLPKGAPSLLVATGMHRLSAMKLIDKSQLDGYVVNELDAYRRDALHYSINNIEGRAPSQNEQILAILDLHEKYSHISLSQLAKEWHIKLSSVQNGAKLRRGINRARNFGYDLQRLKLGGGSRSGDDAVRALGGIWDDAVFDRACHFVVNHAPRVQEIEELCREVRNGPHEQKASLDIIARHEEAAEFKKNQARATFGRTPQGRPERFQSKLKAILRDTEQGLDRLHLSALARPADMEIVVDSMIDLMKRLKVELSRVQAAKMTQQAKKPAAGQLHAGV